MHHQHDMLMPSVCTIYRHAWAAAGSRHSSTNSSSSACPDEEDNEASAGATCIRLG